MTNTNRSTSWQKVHSWYDDLVGDEGHYYHKAVILPGTLALLGLDKASSLLDLACGQGVLSRALPESVKYYGVDISKDLIKRADLRKLKNQKFSVGDITKKLPLAPDDTFTHAAIILALQNTEDPKAVFTLLAPHLHPNGTLVIVINHPCYRIPRQSNWGMIPIHTLPIEKYIYICLPRKFLYKHILAKDRIAARPILFIILYLHIQNF